MGGAVSVSTNNDDMITKLVKANYIRTHLVEHAFRAVDRANYVMEDTTAYSDHAWKTEFLHVSAPCIYAQALEGLNLQPGQSFLNVGSGTGYFSTVVGIILGSEGTNHGIEIGAEAIKYAQTGLNEFKESEFYDRNCFAEPVFIEGNVFDVEYPSNKYHRIYCGAAIPPSFLDLLRDHFLEVGGVLVAPVDDEFVQLYKESPRRDICTTLLDVSFSHLIERDRHQDKDTKIMQLPDCNARSLHELCRVRIVSLVQSKLMEERPTRGGIFANLFASHNCPLAIKKTATPIPTDSTDTVSLKSDSNKETVENVSQSSCLSTSHYVTNNKETEAIPSGSCQANSSRDGTTGKEDGNPCGSSTAEKKSSGRKREKSGRHSFTSQSIENYYNENVEDNIVLRVCGWTLLQESKMYNLSDQSLWNRNPIYKFRNYNPDRYMGIFCTDPQHNSSGQEEEEEEEEEGTSTDFEQDEVDSSSSVSSSEARLQSRPGRNTGNRNIRRLRGITKSIHEKAETIAKCTSSSVFDDTSDGNVSDSNDVLKEKIEVPKTDIIPSSFEQKNSEKESCSEETGNVSTEVIPMDLKQTPCSLPSTTELLDNIVTNHSEKDQSAASSSKADDYVASKVWETGATSTNCSLVERTKRYSSESEYNSSSNSDMNDESSIHRGERRKKAIKRQFSDSPRTTLKSNEDSNNLSSNVSGICKTYEDLEEAIADETRERSRRLSSFAPGSSPREPNFFSIHNERGDRNHRRIVSMLDAVSRRMCRIATKADEVDRDIEEDEESEEEIRFRTPLMAAAAGKRACRACADSDEEPQYFQQMKEKNGRLPKDKKKKKGKLWTIGVEGFNSYVQFRQSRMEFSALPPTTRLNMHIQDRLHQLPLPTRIQDFLMEGRWLNTTRQLPEQVEEDSLC